jgi:hypothetical protein
MRVNKTEVNKMTANHTNLCVADASLLLTRVAVDSQFKKELQEALSGENPQKVTELLIQTGVREEVLKSNVSDMNAIALLIALAFVKSISTVAI